MREGVRNFIVGAASIGGLIGLSAILMMFGELDRWLKPRYELLVALNNAGGLREGSLVTLNGVPVGAVDAVGFIDDADHPVAVYTLIDEAIRLPQGVKPQIESSLIGGGATLQLVGTPGGAALATDGSARIEGTHLTLVEQIAAQLDDRMTPLLNSLESFNTLSQTYTDLGKNLNEMVREQSGDELDGGAAPNIRTAAAKLNEVLDRADEAMELAQTWLGDEQLRSDAKAAVTKATTLFDQATKAVDRYAELAEQLKGQSSEVMAKLLPVMDQLHDSLAHVRRAAQLAADGEGTVGLLLNDPSLYESLDTAAERLQRTLSLVEQLVEKIKAEGVKLEF